MNTTRERLKRILAAAPKDADAGDILGQMADRLLAAGATLPEPSAQLKVWPGLEEAERLYVARYNTPANTTHQGARLAGLAAAAPHLWRALVASLPVLPDVAGLAGCVSVAGHYIPREALAALADPYDGGVT